jgi:hypothetical protein
MNNKGAGSRITKPTRRMPQSRRSKAPIAVAHRRQTPEEQRLFIAAFDVFLAELVRLHLARTERP